jgi:hypothetical protein
VITRSESGGHVLEFHEACECHGKRAHLYILNDRIVPGATDVKKGYPVGRQLIRYFINQGIEEFDSGRKLKKDADIGTYMHDYCHALRMNLKLEAQRIQLEIAGHPDEDRIRRRLDEVTQWVNERRETERVVAAEEIVAYVCSYHRGLTADESACNCAAGKFDCLVEKNGRIILQDYKSAKGFFVEQFIQAGGYSKMLKHWNNIQVDGLEIIRFNDNTEKPDAFLIDNSRAIQDFQEQFFRCRDTRTFQNVWETYFSEKYEREILKR